MSKNRAIMGFGNPVRADDGIGIYVIDRLKEQVTEQNEIDILDMGTSAFEVLYQLKGKEEIILVDAVMNSEETPGTVFKLPASEINAQINDDPLVFLHGLKWDQALSYAKKILGDEYPENITVYLVAIDNTKFNTGLTESVKMGGDKVVDHIIQHLDSNKD